MVEEPQSELEALQAALGARARIRQWAEGAELLDLLHAAASEGWLEALTRPVTAADLAGLGGSRPSAPAGPSRCSSPPGWYARPEPRERRPPSP
jgi:hypothetical protein